jgi:predicted phosphodiesterase
MLTVIGDVHGYYDSYLKIATKCNATVQVGDFGFNYEVLQGMDPDLHKIIGGNHDNYDEITSQPYYLGDYGKANVGGVDFFFVRGERSVDAHLRIEGRTWWRAEELDMKIAYKAIEAYESAKPDIVISHGCPAEILPFFVTNPAKYHPSRTAQILDSMWNSHRPKLWIFGHHHKSETLKVGDCTFRCLNELESIEI